MYCIRPGLATLTLLALLAARSKQKDASMPAAAAAAASAVSAATPTPTATPASTPAATAAPAPAVSADGRASSPVEASSHAERAASIPSVAMAAPRRVGPLPPPRAVGSWAEVREQAAHRLIEANPDQTYAGTVVEPLLAIAVLEIELNGNGSVHRIVVRRPPRFAKDTTAIAEAAIRRAAPFGDVSRLPRPWRFTETFLFDESRRFKPRTLD